MSKNEVQQGDLVIYTDTKKFSEFLGEVAIIRKAEPSDLGTIVTVEWMNSVQFQGSPAGLSKFSIGSFDRVSVNISNWSKSN